MFVFDVNHINRSEYATIENWTGLLAYGILNLTSLCVQSSTISFLRVEVEVRTQDVTRIYKISEKIGCWWTLLQLNGYH